MGIPGLLPFLKRACYEVSDPSKGNVSDFSRKTLLVDASCLLHRGLFGCADKVAMGQDTSFYIGYMAKYVNYLLAQQCHVILVFDGRPLPAKKETNDSRREGRREYQQLGERLMRQGLLGEAYKAFSRGTELTRDVVEKSIRAFRKVPNVDIIVAPYESDAQIAYLMQNGLAHAVVTEDSDLVVFGCEKILFKMNPTNGQCLVYEQKKLPLCVCPVLRRRFDFATFRRICILAGCDYLQGGLQGVGLKGAEEVFAKTNQPDLKTLLPRLPLYLGKRLRAKLDRNFVSDFIKAENTFLYQIVFDPLTREQLPLNPYPKMENGNHEVQLCSKHSYAGKIMSSPKALRLALGNAEHALSKPTLEDEFVLPVPIPTWSIWHEQYKNLVAKERELRKRQLDQQFGAFRPTKSPVKRSVAQPVNLSLSSIEVGQMDDDEAGVVIKRRCLTEIQLNSKPRNGAYAGWARNDWMRMYGCGEGKKQDPQQKDGETGVF